MTQEIKLEENDKLIIRVGCGCEFVFDSKQGVVFIIGNCQKHDQKTYVRDASEPFLGVFG